MGKFNVLYFSIALIIREKFFFVFNILLNTALFFYITINFETLHFVGNINSSLHISKTLYYSNILFAIGISGLLSGSRIIHSISDTGIMLAIGTNRLGIILLTLCKELLYFILSYFFSFFLLVIFFLNTDFNFFSLGVAFLRTMIFSILGSVSVSLPLSFYFTSIDPYESIRKQK
ncbi:MAG: hypothetical protein L6Q54_08525 [Leptospiraceae bacterium]|nr:hypothetical protein [Leptospiraceae bacterium]MCK6381278.1 hypothetical protein [Leptospiraceae bacterium]NUM40409.1 hypothetical protein [Leptospiraceae bacterium]